MAHNQGQPFVVIEGIDAVIKRDLEKHQGLLERSKMEKLAFVQARSHEVQRKRAWRKHIGGGKFDDKALQQAIAQIAQNIAHLSAKAKLSDDAIDHHTLIVDTLTAQLEEYHIGMARLAQSRSNGNAHPD